MATISLYIDKRRAKKDGSYPLKLNVRNVGQFLVSLPYSVTDKTFINGEFTKNFPNYKIKNAALKKLLSNIEFEIIRLSEEERNITDDKLKVLLNELIKGRKSSKLLTEYIQKFADNKEKFGTKKNYLTTLSKVKEYDSNATLESVNIQWIEGFEKMLLNSGMKINACAVRLRDLRAVFNWCIDNEETTNYPFRKFKIKQEQTKKRSLTVNQLIELRDYPVEEYQVKYRDMFMLMFYLIGINAADLYTAKELVNGRLEYVRAKTGKLYSVKVEPEAMNIIQKYKGQKYLLDILDNHKNYEDFLHRQNIALQNIGPMERKGRGGKKQVKALFPNISTYWTRHTWATIAHKIGVPKDTISLALGHSFGLDVTSIYIDFDRDKIDEANRKVIDYVNNPDKYKEYIELRSDIMMMRE